MEIGKAARREIGRAPVGTTFTVLSGTAGVAGVAIALKMPAISGGEAAGSPPEDTSATAYVAALATSLAITAASAGLSRLALRIAAVPSYFLSILLACCSILGSALVLDAYNVRFLGGASVDHTGQVLYWGTVLLFAALNGESTAETFRRWNAKIPLGDQSASDSALGAAGMLGLLILAWALAVSQGQEWLVSRILNSN